MIKNNKRELLSVLVIEMPFSGPTETVMSVRSLLEEFRPRFMAMTGICAGYKKKVALGDLVAAAYAFHYQEGKVEADEEGLDRLRPEWRTHSTARRIVQYINHFTAWETPLTEMKQRMLGRKFQESERPRCLVAPVASGMAVQGNNPFPRLLEHNRKVWFLDQEIAAFYQTLSEFPDMYFLAVKGVCDNGDPNKNDDYHKYAARASAVYLLYFIQEYVTEQTMPRRDALLPIDRARSFGAWNVPHARNPYFTGRDELLDRLDQQLSPEAQDDTTTTSRAALTQPQAIKGLGGIGKTQIAVEYAYRSRDHGRYAHILWINAASEEMIIMNFVRIAELLPAFSAKSETDLRKLITAVKLWLEQCDRRWLLIFDNADDLSVIQEYLPQRGSGSILLTTRAHAVGSLATSLEVEKMGLIEGTEFLLHRAQHLDYASDEERNEATKIVVALDCFPLALDQAGAYIEEAGCSFVDYLQIYQDHRKALLARRGLQATDYPDSVATTWSLSFQKVEQANPAAAELLRLCALLAPDAIPEELIRGGAAHWSPLLQQAATDLLAFNQVIEELLKYSLVKRLAGIHILSIHRLVQAVQMDMLEEDEQRQWAERLVRAMNDVFPSDPEEVATWPQCLRYLEQAQACNALIKQHMFVFIEAVAVLNRTGTYLCSQALYTVAETLFRHTLAISEQQLGPEHPGTGSILNNLALLYYKQGKYGPAESLSMRALAIYGQLCLVDDPEAATALDNLAAICERQGNYADAEPLCWIALDIRRKRLGPTHRATDCSRNNLAAIYMGQGKYEQAEILLQESLALCEQHPSSKPLDTAIILNNLAELYHEQGKYLQAEPLYRRALQFCEQYLGPDYPSVACVLTNLAFLRYHQGKYAEAERLHQRALRIFEQRLGPDHPDVAYPLIGLAILYKAQNNDRQAELFYQRALPNIGQALHSTHLDLAETLHDLAISRQTQGHHNEAQSLYEDALAIRTQALGSADSYTTSTRRLLAILLRAMGKTEEATRLEEWQAMHQDEQNQGRRKPQSRADESYK